MTPELHVTDFEPIKQYYTSLGFNICWERPPEGFKGYLVIELEDNIICFWGGNDRIFEQPHFKQFPQDTPRGYGVELVLTVKDIRAYYEQVKDRANVVEPLVMQPWGLEDFRCADPAGYYLRFTSQHDVRDPKFAVQ
jgi:hypothetical protein